MLGRLDEEMKDTAKLENLESNDDVMIQSVPLKDRDSAGFLTNVLQMLGEIRQQYLTCNSYPRLV